MNRVGFHRKSNPFTVRRWFRHTEKRLLVISSVLLLCTTAAIGSEKQPTQDDAAFHRSLLTIDAHIDIKTGFNTADGDASQETMDQFDLPKLRRGALDVAVVSLYVGPKKITPPNIRKAKETIEDKLVALRDFVASHPTDLAFVTTADEIIDNGDKQMTSILLSSLNSLPFGENIASIEKYFDKGVRIFGFTHAQNTPFADSSRPARHFGDVPGEGGGITDLGAEAIKLINRLGAVVDVSQLSKQAVLQAVALSDTPVLATHSAPSSQVDVPRNLSDEEMIRIAEAGGVIHVVAFSPWLRRSELYYEHYYGQIFKPVGLPSIFDTSVPRVDPAVVLSEELYAAYKLAYLSFERNIWRYSDLDDYLDAIEAVVKLVGVDHVGISSDFNHGGGVFGFANVADAPNLTERLRQRGFSKSEIAKIWGENFLRVLRAAEQHAVAVSEPKVVAKPIVFNERRSQLSVKYLHDRYDIEQADATIVPKMVVVHWTSIRTMEETFAAFDPAELPGARQAIGSASTLNVSSQYLIDRDGTIYQLLPDTVFARHVIGLNYCAIGIENVGNGTDLPLTEAQLRSNVALIRKLSGKYDIEYVIGHHEYSQFIGHALWKETDPNYLTEKTDPGKDFMARLRIRLSDLALKGAPDKAKASGPNLIDER